MTKDHNMEQAFIQIRGALQRKDETELRCKQIWLKDIMRDLPNTVWDQLARELHPKISQVLVDVGLKQ